MKQLHEKTAIIAGADREPGREIALHLARLGVKAVCAGGNQALLLRTERKLKAAGGQCFSVVCDAAGREQIRAAVRKAAELWGSVDILLNGISFVEEHPPVPAESVRQEELDNIWAAGPAAVVLWMQECFPYMKEQGEGRIINLLRSGGDIPGAAVQGAVRAVSGAVAAEWVQYGICVNCVLAARAEELGPVAAFLSGPDSRFYSGKCLRVDGGPYAVLP